MGAIAIAAMAIVATLDYLSGREFSFTLLYLVPIAVAIAFVGPLPGFLLCVIAAGSGMRTELADHAPVSAALWNAGVRLGVYLVFYALFSFVLDNKATKRRIALARKCLDTGAALAVFFFVAAGFAKYEETLRPPAGKSVGDSSNSVGHSDESHFAELNKLVPQSLGLCRPLLLGSRDPSGPSCVRISPREMFEG